MSIVKQLLVLSASGSILLACGTSRQVYGQDIPEPLLEKAGEEVAQVLTRPDAVILYILQDEPGTVEILPYYYRKDEGKPLSVPEVAVLQFLLTENPANFEDRDGALPSAPYLPFVEFFFQKGKEGVSLLVSTSNMTWSLVRGKHEIVNLPYTDVRAVERLVNGLCR